MNYINIIGQVITLRWRGGSLFDGLWSISLPVELVLMYYTHNMAL